MDGGKGHTGPSSLVSVEAHVHLGVFELGIVFLYIVTDRGDVLEERLDEEVKILNHISYFLVRRFKENGMPHLEADPIRSYTPVSTKYIDEEIALRTPAPQ